MDPETRTTMLNDYIHGRLDAGQRRIVEDLLGRDSDARAEYEFLAFLPESLVIPAPDVAADHGFDALMVRIRHQSQIREPIIASAGIEQQPVPGFWVSTFGWLFRPSLSYAVAGSVLAAQFALLAVFYQGSVGEGGFSELRNQPTVPPVAGPFIRVSLKPDTKESDIRFLLISLGATIIGGPTQLGDYFIFVPPERTDWAAQQMRQSPITDQVKVIATLPPLKD